MKKIAIILCLIGSVSLTSAKETIYVKYEPSSCIQQYYYKSATNSGSGLVTEYYDYHVKLNNSERTVVRSKKVGTYKKSDYALTKSLINCDNKKTHTFQSLTGKVANGEKEIFFIEEENGNYHIYKGMSASYEIYNSQYFYSHSPDYAFRFIYNKDYAPSQKLKEDRTSGVTTMFVGKDKKGCNEQFGVVQMPEHVCSTQVSKEYLKDVGLYIEKNTDGFFMLKKIDDMPLDDYLKWRCSGFRTDMRPNNRPSEYDKLVGENTAKGDVQTNIQPTVSSNTNANTTATTINNNGGSMMIATYNKIENTTKGGEVIPTEYNETSAATNNITDNFIIATYANSTKKETTDNSKLDNKLIPTQYDTEVINTKGTAVKPLKGRHFVVKGDTLYSLSKKYGVSIDEIKSWNHLPDNTIAIGDTIVVNKSAFVF